MTEWKPIETAPKDGTAILVYQPNDPSQPDFLTVSLVLWNGWWQLVECGSHADDCDPTNDNPTHWMPLPAPPSAK